MRTALASGVRGGWTTAMKVCISVSIEGRKLERVAGRGVDIVETRDIVVAWQSPDMPTTKCLPCVKAHFHRWLPGGGRMTGSTDIDTHRDGK